MNISERISRLRSELNLKQHEFAEPLGVDRSYIAALENGKREPSDILINLISLYYGVSVTWLKIGEGEMFISPEESLKNLMAHYGEQAITEAFNNIQTSKESSTDIIDVTALTRRVYDKDPELKRMIDTLYMLFSAGDEELKAWASYQFKRAFPPDVVEDAQKKQQEINRPASTS
ncbi:MAG: hypothetical protein JL56_11475 [Desulfotomaculum sp. BICA1-6]|nr:MAG: hypothetical protein JL56_11475 [Desulfotomaculum sp. BICA1-6]